MIPEKWDEIKGMIKKNFEVFDSGKKEVEDKPEANLEFIEFDGPLGKMRLEYITSPKVLDKKTNYSNRIGGNVTVEYVYSENEMVHTLKAYKWDDNDDTWMEAEFNL